MEWMLDEESLAADADPETREEDTIDDEETLEILKACHTDAVSAGQLHRAKVLSMLVARYTPDRSGDEENNEDNDDDEEEEEKSASDEEEEEEVETARTISMTQRQWDALLDWGRSAVKQDNDVATRDLSRAERRVIENVVDTIDGDWQVADPDRSEKFEFEFSTSDSIDLANDTFYELNRGRFIADGVSSNLRRTIVAAATVFWNAI